MLDKELIKKNFSKYARYYDRHASVQNLCALKLIERIKAGGFGKILDVGCGTGNYTGLLKERFPMAKIKAMDISGEMIEIAKEKLNDNSIEFIIADGETTNFEERFDLIGSNAVFQWFENLEITLSGYKDSLNEKGVISFSIFGPLTFNELDGSLKELYGDEAAISSRGFAEKETIEKILKGLFRKIEVEQKIYKERYASLLKLLKKIKYTGTRGNGLNKNFWTAGKADKTEKIYKKKYKDIIATYQVFFCKGVK
ncbi:MAG: malonyl-ACP O-methyltransferase BioC [Candidatus Omnitrophota bacterium]|nr:malonyl-ACP O-methyltransferase BioC [Candidatus Omnitrophota bacterium]